MYLEFNQPRTHSLTCRIGYEHRFSRHYALDAALSGRSQGKPQSGRTDVDQGYTIFSTTSGAVSTSTPPSTTFSITSLKAIITPLRLQRAYPSA